MQKDEVIHIRITPDEVDNAARHAEVYQRLTSHLIAELRNMVTVIVDEKREALKHAGEL